MIISHGLRASVNKPVLKYITLSTSSANQTTYTFSGVNIGTADQYRFVVVCVRGWSGSTATRTVSSLTIAGTTATSLVNPSNQYAGAIYGLTVTSGTTADIVVTFSSSMNNAGIFVYTVNNLQSTTAIDTSDISVTNATASDTLTTKQDGIIIAHMMCGPVASFSSWTNLTSNVTSDLETAPIASASIITPAATRTITSTISTSAAHRLTAVSLR